MAGYDFSINDAPTMGPAFASGGGRRLAAGDTILGRYAVVRELGEGGMGVVYQCLDTVGGVEVAVKSLPPEVSRNEDEMDDIRANYQIVRKLRHPNIAGVATLEKDTAAGDYYLVMDLAAGVTLKRWARRHSDAGLDAKLAILRQFAAALDYAHAEKVIHRDVKPENVMVDDDGGVKVLDFGLAAQIRSSQSRTSNTVTSKGGTPGYKSPEQWLGRPQQAPADVYAFGVMAYWFFSGHLPFDGDDPVVLGHAVLSAPVEPIPDLPAHMNAALVKALAKKPEDRFSSCGAFVAALEGKVFSRVDGAVGSRVPRDRTGGSRSRAPAILAAAALGLAVAGGWWYVNARAARSTGTTGVPPIATNAAAGTTGVSSVATEAAIGTTGVPPVATNAAAGTTGVPPVATNAAAGTTGVSPVATTNLPPVAKPTWEETQRAINEATRHVLYIRRRVKTIIETTIKPYRVHSKCFGEILAEIDKQHESLKNLQDPKTISEARKFTSDAENASDEIENKCIRKLEERLKFCVSEEIRSAKEFFEKSERGEGDYWNEAIAAADRALALESSNDEAKKLKKDAESHLVPTLRVVSEIGGSEISGAKVKAGDESFTTPFVWKLKEGSRYGPYKVSYESGGKRYYGTLDEVTVDWHGSKCMSVALEEYVEPPQRAPDSHVSYSDVIHTVSRGEFLATISRKYNVKMSAIVAANPGLNPNRFYVGQKIRIPNAKVPTADVDGDESGFTNRPTYVPYVGQTREYIVKGGDSLGKIAYENKISIRALKELNGLTIDNVRVGMRLKIPVGRQKVATVGRIEEIREQKTGDTKTITLPGGATMEMIYVGPGSFTMGDENGDDDERPVHKVRLTKGYWLGRYEVTQAQWQSVMENNPSSFRGDNRPVEGVSWEDCQIFVGKINSQLECGARLPTEAEWEYACRTSSVAVYDGVDNIDEEGWHAGNSGNVSHAVGQKRANSWGLYDMHGNVSEWCLDETNVSTSSKMGNIDKSYHVAKGGSWFHDTDSCGISQNFAYSSDNRSFTLGFRLLLQE